MTTGQNFGSRDKLKIKCPNCGCSLRGITKEMIGDTGVCPKCNTEFIIDEQIMPRRVIFKGKEKKGTFQVRIGMGTAIVILSYSLLGIFISTIPHELYDSRRAYAEAAQQEENLKKAQKRFEEEQKKYQELIESRKEEPGPHSIIAPPVFETPIVTPHMKIDKRFFSEAENRISYISVLLKPRRILYLAFIIAIWGGYIYVAYKRFFKTSVGFFVFITILLVWGGIEARKGFEDISGFSFIIWFMTAVLLFLLLQPVLGMVKENKSKRYDVKIDARVNYEGKQK